MRLAILIALTLSLSAPCFGQVSLFVRAQPTASPTLTTEPGYYLAGIGQAAPYVLPNSATYGQVGLAARIGWRWIQPLKSGAYTWTLIDGYQTAAHQANNNAGAPWSLSVTAGAYTPLWMFYPTGQGSNPCTASTSGVSPTEDGPQNPGTAPIGALQAFQFNWQSGFVYQNGTTQCLPLPWDNAYQTAWQTLINAIAAHVGPYGQIATDPLLDHVVLTGVNSTTQENSLPSCSTAGATCGIGGVSDVQEWENIIAAIPDTCTGNSLALCPGFDSSTATDYTSRIQAAYTTIAGYWATAFPTKKYATDYVDGAAFPFNSYPSVTGLKFLNHTNSLYPTTSYLQNNAASGSSPYIANKITCYTVGVTGCQPPPTGFVQTSGTISAQEGAAVAGAGCATLSKFTAMMSAAKTDQSKFMEIYPADVACMP